MAFSGNGPVEDWRELKRGACAAEEDGDKDDDSRNNEMTLKDGDRDVVM